MISKLRERIEEFELECDKSLEINSLVTNTILTNTNEE